MKDPDTDPIKWVGRKLKEGIEKEAQAQRTADIVEQRQRERERKAEERKSERVKRKAEKWLHQERKKRYAEIEADLKSETGEYYQKPTSETVTFFAGVFWGAAALAIYFWFNSAGPTDNADSSSIPAVQFYEVNSARESTLHALNAPTVEGAIIFEFGHGVSFEIIERSDEGWVLVRTQSGDEGWVKEHLISPVK